MHLTPWRPITALALAALLLGACGDDDGDARGDPSPTAPADTADDPAGGDADGGASDGDASDGGAFVAFDCPLRAEQVGEVVGATVVKNDATCIYLPDGAGTPAVHFSGGDPTSCDAGQRDVSGYTEPIDGLGVDAYVKSNDPAAGAILACGEMPFETVVDFGPGATEDGVAAATALARLVLEGG